MTSTLRILGRTLEIDDVGLPEPVETVGRPDDEPDQRPDDPPRRSGD